MELGFLKFQPDLLYYQKEEMSQGKKKKGKAPGQMLFLLEECRN